MEKNAAIDKLIEHYSEKFELCRNVEIAGVTASAVASMRNHGTVSILGFSTGKTGPAACEHIFMIACERFDEAMLEQIAGLFAEAERAYVTPGKDHAYTFLSAAVFAGEVQKTAAAPLKKYKYRRDYGQGGWMLARIAVLDESGASLCNRDGTDFKNLILKVLKGG